MSDEQNTEVTQEETPAEAGETAAEDSGEVDKQEVSEAIADGNDETNPDHLTAVYDIPVKLQAVLGSASMPVNQLLKLGRGAVVELNKKVGEPVEIYVNNRLVARGEVVVVDENLGVTMTEIIKSEQ